VKNVFLIPIKSVPLQNHVNETYEGFLELARRFSAIHTNSLTDTDDIAQLQDLHYLVKEGALKISEEQTSDGRHYFLLELNHQPYSLMTPEFPNFASKDPALSPDGSQSSSDLNPSPQTSSRSRQE
jgi:hypothetical protein